MLMHLIVQSYAWHIQNFADQFDSTERWICRGRHCGSGRWRVWTLRDWTLTDGTMTNGFCR